MTRSPLTGRHLAACTFVLPAVLAAAAPPASAQARPDTIALDPIVVTATRLAMPRNAVPVAVTVLTGETLRASGVRFVADALRTAPGLSVVRVGSAGGLTSVFMRGAESDHVQVLIDGVPINDPGGAVDLARVSTADVERVEIVRGPASVLYGTDAAAGVIQIFTRRGTGPPRVDAAVGGEQSRQIGPGAGTANTFDAGVTVSGGGARSHWGLTAARTHDDGVYRLNNDFANTSLSGSVELQPAAGTTVSFSLRRNEGLFRFPTDGGGLVSDANQFRESRTTAAAFEVSQAVGRSVEVHAALTSHAADHLLDDEPDSPADTLGFFALRVRDRLLRQRADLRADIRSRNAALSVGATAERQHGRSATASRSAWGPFEDASDHHRSSRAGYVQLVATPERGLSMTAGSRVEDSDHSGTLLTWRAGIRLHDERGGIRLAAGSGFKEPTFYENFAQGFVRGNPDLAPERTRSAELGLDRRFGDGRLRLEATAFVQQMRNLIQYTAAPPAPDGANYFNVGAARSAGFELAANLNPARAFGLDVAYTRLETRVTDAGFGTDRAFLQDRPLLRRPRHQADLAARWRTGAGQVDAGLSLVGRRDDLDFADPTDFAGTRVSLEARALASLGYTRTLWLRGGAARLELHLRVSNLFDQRYEEVRNFPARGRTLGLGLRAGI